MWTTEISYPMPIFKVTTYFIDGEKIATVCQKIKKENNISVNVDKPSILVLTDKFNKNEFVSI